jgi:TFIIF-interacting CTD phosphatase-like protein
MMAGERKGEEVEQTARKPNRGVKTATEIKREQSHRVSKMLGVPTGRYHADDGRSVDVDAAVDEASLEVTVPEAASPEVDA